MTNFASKPSGLMILLLRIIVLVSSEADVSSEVASSTFSDSSIPYPFEPPSSQFCKNNSLGSDIYVSIFSPCVFTFYKNNTSLPSSIRTFSCTEILNNTIDEKVVIIEERKVVGWPDSCVATGPRCYDLNKHPELANFTLFDESSYYSMPFPADATVVSVDCSQDYRKAKEAMKNLPHELEPIAHAIMFFGLMMLLGSLLCVFLCCTFVCSGYSGRYDTKNTYTPIGVYGGPPVQARKVKGEKEAYPRYQVVV
mmetsp:Transcript_4612/g.6014  ORF Transcript_4612/g.6014 Transcript_4612/m.6014 type:complete len:253 (+) Transcript_4612:77-835(+)